MNEWDGKNERRAEYCPVHHLKCGEWKSTEEAVKSKVPIWVFRIFLTILVVILGAMNVNSYRENKAVLEAVNEHVEKSNKILSAMSHGLNEVAVNQRKILRTLKLEFEELPDYKGD